MKDEKLLGEERRASLIQWLQQADKPLTGRELGEWAGVSRQVIVGDITLLKAQGHPILATSQGYLFIQPEQIAQIERQIVCQHTPEETLTELQTIVDHGVRVKDVTVEHPIYGEITAAIHVSTRKEAQVFIENVQQHNAVYLSNLSEDAIHLHTLIADSEEKIEAAIADLRQAGFLVEK